MREIPTPAHLSEQARAYLAAPFSHSVFPALDDVAGWRAYAARGDELMRTIMPPLPGDVVEIDADGVRVFVCTPPEMAREDVIYLDIHGGALVSGGGEVCKLSGLATAAMVRARTWAVDYRMPPHHPYPTPLDDCVAAHRALLRERDPRRIIVGGMSAGGNLAPALILRARDQGLPMPAAAILISPEVDLTESGDSFATNLGLDSMGSLMPANLLCAGGHDLRDPYVSPLFGDFSQGFPSTLVTAGTRDLFLSNAVRLHRALRAADVAAELHIMEAAPHVAFPGSLEEQELHRELRRFAERHWRRELPNS